MCWSEQIMHNREKLRDSLWPSLIVSTSSAQIACLFVVWFDSLIWILMWVHIQISESCELNFVHYSIARVDFCVQLITSSTLLSAVDRICEVWNWIGSCTHNTHLTSIIMIMHVPAMNCIQLMPKKLCVLLLSEFLTFLPLRVVLLRSNSNWNSERFSFLIFGSFISTHRVWSVWANNDICKVAKPLRKCKVTWAPINCILCVMKDSRVAHNSSFFSILIYECIVPLASPISTSLSHLRHIAIELSKCFRSDYVKFPPIECQTLLITHTRWCELDSNWSALLRIFQDQIFN